MSGVRFAPSPTGRFHIGNLRTAWIAKTWANALKLPLVIRFEDIDTLRVIAGALEQQTEDMRAIGVVANGTEIQSANRTRHLELFHRAISEKKIYPCVCTRKELREALEGAASAPHAEPPVYNGACREKRIENRDLPSVAWRWKADDASGKYDFIVARTSRIEPDDTSFMPGYHWACAIDDHDGKYDLLVRSWDLESSLAPQRAVMNWLRGKLPAVFHTSLITQEDGHRLEKRTKGVTLPELEITPMDLVVHFAKSTSFSPSEYMPSKAWGEIRKTLKLSALGI